MERRVEVNTSESGVRLNESKQEYEEKGKGQSIILRLERTTHEEWMRVRNEVGDASDTSNNEFAKLLLKTYKERTSCDKGRNNSCDQSHDPKKFTFRVKEEPKDDDNDTAPFIYASACDIQDSLSENDEFYVCEECGRSFTDHASFSSHLESGHTSVIIEEKTHTNGQTEETELSLDRQQNETVPSKTFNHDPSKDESNLKCDECGRVFTKAFSLKVHKRIHPGHSSEQPFVCDVCGKGFPKSNLLAKHEETHMETPPTPYECPICGNRFRQTCGLKSHMLRHTGEKPYKCGDCGRAFRTSYTLKRHSFIHTPDKPHQCDICGESFIQASALINHKSIHTGEKDFACDVCGKAFSTYKSLKNHKPVHTDQYACEICAKTYCSASVLARHMSRVHKSRSIESDG